MCGRYGFTKTNFQTYGIAKSPAGFVPVYNGAPSMRMPIIFEKKKGEKHVMLARFGLVPSWSKTPTVSYSTINATAERVFESPVFRGPIRFQRALIPVDFYFEWKGLSDKSKQPYLFRMISQDSFAFGGMYDVWHDVEDKVFPSFSIVTTVPNELMKHYHHRMPLILPRERWNQWLSPGLSDLEIKNSMVPYAHPELMEALAVSTLVNSPRNDDERIIQSMKESQRAGA